MRATAVAACTRTVLLESPRARRKAEEKLGGKKFPVLVVCPATANTNIHLMRHLKENKNNPFSVADAFVIAATSQAILGNFYLKINKPERPTKFFNREVDALEWLNQFFN